MDDGAFALTDRVALVTGAARGLGAALAHGMAAAGARVVVADVDLAGAERTAAAIGAPAQAAEVDVASPDSCAWLVEEVLATHGRLDVLVNNAGVDAIKPAKEVTPADWERILGVNLVGAACCARAAADPMRRQGGGAIVNVSSIAGRVGIPDLLPYSASKAALSQVTRVLAVEWAAAGIRVNAVAPGYLENVMADAGDEHARPEKQRALLARTPLGRRARLEEVVGPVVFLASSAASYVTGQVLYVDGGWTAA